MSSEVFVERFEREHQQLIDLVEAPDSKLGVIFGWSLMQFTGPFIRTALIEDEPKTKAAFLIASKWAHSLQVTIIGLRLWNDMPDEVRDQLDFGLTDYLATLLVHDVGRVVEAEQFGSLAEARFDHEAAGGGHVGEVCCFVGW